MSGAVRELPREEIEQIIECLEEIEWHFAAQGFSGGPRFVPFPAH